ncbi:hypothetical protein FB45DRAFT_878286 [Roridomyces roridus]|uniref:Uncharacterized protein n=1 Tax=Roridomyces roridus TaxID=1738132 RepID=A0AAD7B0U7_9AGAR|nr:hypothetical protein FB45DRAFT_878286 [Roridomyces roridus]
MGAFCGRRNGGGGVSDEAIRVAIHLVPAKFEESAGKPNWDTWSLKNKAIPRHYKGPAEEDRPGHKSISEKMTVVVESKEESTDQSSLMITLRLDSSSSNEQAPCALGNSWNLAEVLMSSPVFKLGSFLSC